MKIVSEFDNPLLDRKEYVVEIIHPGSSTPSRKEVRERMAKALGVPVSRVIVRKLKSRYGVNKTIARIHVYNTEESVKIEPEYIIKRNVGAQGGE